MYIPSENEQNDILEEEIGCSWNISPFQLNSWIDFESEQLQDEIFTLDTGNVQLETDLKTDNLKAEEANLTVDTELAAVEDSIQPQALSTPVAIQDSSRPQAISTPVVIEDSSQPQALSTAVVVEDSSQPQTLSTPVAIQDSSRP